MKGEIQRMCKPHGHKDTKKIKKKNSVVCQLTE